MLLAIIICFSSYNFVFAAESSFSVEELAVELINDAFKHPDEFDLPNIGSTNVYLCEAVNPYALENRSLQAGKEIEYYFVITDSEYIACITLCYKNDEPVSVSLNVSLADSMNSICGINDAFQLVAHNGTMYVKTQDSVDIINPNTCIEPEEITTEIKQASGNLQRLSTKTRLTGIVTNPAISRSSVTMSIPYVPQEGGTCWAAAGSAFGQYYNPKSKYAAYSSAELANLMGVDINEGAGMNVTRNMLSKYFGVSTVYYNDALSFSAAINLFQQRKPILAGFYNDDFGVGHMVVLCGYNDWNTGEYITFYIRDSNFPTLQTVKCKYTSTLILDYGYAYPMEWAESAYYGTAA